MNPLEMEDLFLNIYLHNRLQQVDADKVVNSNILVKFVYNKKVLAQFTDSDFRMDMSNHQYFLEIDYLCYMKVNSQNSSKN